MHLDLTFHLFKHTITQSLIQSLEMVLADTEIIWKISPGLLLISATTPTPTLIRPRKSSSKHRKKKVAFFLILSSTDPILHVLVMHLNHRVKVNSEGGGFAEIEQMLNPDAHLQAMLYVLRVTLWLFSSTL